MKDNIWETVEEEIYSEVVDMDIDNMTSNDIAKDIRVRLQKYFNISIKD